MAKSYMADEIFYCGVPYFVEERHHKELFECKSGSFIRAMLYFSECKNIPDYWQWQENGNSLEVRYWDTKPSDDERANTPWTPYIIYVYGSGRPCVYGNERLRSKIARLTEKQFEELKKEYPLRKLDKPKARIIMEQYTCDWPKMEIVRNRE